MKVPGTLGTLSPRALLPVALGGTQLERQFTPSQRAELETNRPEPCS